MATQAIDQIPADEAEAAPSGSSKRQVIILAAAGLLVGSATGLFGIGPILANKKSAPPPAASEPPGSSVSHAIANLVLNPAGTGGNRFLMVTATFQVKDGGVDQILREHDAEVRDRILSLLGKKTIEELSNIAQRETIKQEVLTSVASMFPRGAVLKLFFEQFVIQ